MGRGKGDKDETTAAIVGSRRNAVQTAEAEQLAEYDQYLGPLSRRFSQAAFGKATQEAQNQARARAVKQLSEAQQRKLIEIAQETKRLAEENPDSALAERAKAIGDRAREIFIFSHTGYVMQYIRKHVGAFESESNEDALLVLRQEAYLGLNEAMDRFRLHYTDEDGSEKATEHSPLEEAAVTAVDNIKHKQANPLTFAVGRIRHRVSEAKETGPLITAKSRAFDERQKVQAAARRIESSGHPVTLAQIVEDTGVPQERAAQLLRSLAPKARFDAPSSVGGDSDGEGTSLASVIPDSSINIESAAVSDAEREIVRSAAEQLNPFQRRVIEAHFNLTDGEDVEQKDLYDGVYRDPVTNAAFSSEGTVISDRARRGEEVTKASQKELNQRFREGQLVFEAGTPESFELALLKKASQVEDLPEPTREERLGRVITRTTGIPMTSGQIQDAKDQALYDLSQLPELQALRPRYRGNSELENSLQARQLVRRALTMVEAVSPKEAQNIKAGRAAKDGSHKRGELGQIALERGWLDEKTGRVIWGKLREDVNKAKQARQANRHADLEDSDELAEIMATA